MLKRTSLVLFRLLCGGAVLGAITLQAVTVAQAGTFLPWNFFSYFTNLSNILAAVVFIISALYLAKSRKPSVRDDTIRGAAVLYMAVTGVVYNTLLINQNVGLLIPWVNILLHVVMPLAVIADWLYQPPKTKLTVSQAGVWLFFPVVYVIYTLIRGALVHWYPYPFLNPDKVGGYGGVAAYCLGIVAAFFVVGWLILRLGTTLKRNVS